MRKIPTWPCLIGAISLLLLSLGCGQQGGSNTGDPDLITEILNVSTPDLSQFEPAAREALEKQRNTLNDLILAKDTPQSTMGIAYGQMGTQYLAHRFFGPALECLRNAAFLNKDAYRWRYFLGRLHLEQDRTEQAKKAFQHVLEMNPQHVASKILLGQIELKSGNTEQAEALFKEALTEKPQSAVAQRELGRIYLDRGEYQKAAAHLQTCLLIQPYARAVHGDLAKALHGMDQGQAAAIQERAAATRQPILSDPLMDEVLDQRFLLLYRVSEALRLSQRDEEAAGMYDLAIDIRPDLKGPRVGRALSLIRSGEHQRAVECLEDDILATKDSDNFKHMLARLLAASSDTQVRNPEKSLRILEELRSDNMSPDLVETIAMALSNLDKFESAINYQQTAIDMAIQAEQSDRLPALEANLAKYRDKQACKTPWQPDDPLYSYVAYKGESELQKRPGT